ncbi:kininogen-1-like [Crotalus tigris]|uniref:kininogen-1-like n=1 Tax=Crotalus tigris TaxID=88082 RepID=UPI00192F8EE0|nr:kininogen-1-like [Crotalus tigris]
MEVFILLVLSIGLCKAVHGELGKDDPEVVNAVATAIKVLNEDRSHGNKFALGVILDAYRIADARKTFLIIYQVRETACPIAADEPWQKCDLLRTSKGHSGTCIAAIDINESQQFTFIEQNCKIKQAEDNKRSRAQECPGCHNLIAADSQELNKPLEDVVKLINLKSSSDFYFKIVKITKISGKMLVGHVYRIDFKAQRTNCSKTEVEKPDENCTAVKGGELMSCHALVYVKPWEPSVKPEVTCTENQPLQTTELGESNSSGFELTVYDDDDDDDTINKHHF